jgi:Sigma-70, region 4
MPSLDSLPGDQRAVLQLVLGRGRSYEEIARLLSINPSGVRDRAMAALDALGPETSVSAEHRRMIGDYLLGQSSAKDADQVRDLLVDSPVERAWARVLSSELAPLASGPLPEIPTEKSPPRSESGAAMPLAQSDAAAAAAGEAAPSVSEPAAGTSEDEPDDKRDGGGRRERTPKPEGGPRTSRIGGAVIIAAAVVVAAVVVFLVVRGGGSKRQPVASAPTTASTPAAGAGSTTSASTTATTASSTTSAKVVAQINLLPPSGHRSKAAGIAEILTEGKANGVAIVAQSVPPNKTAPPDAYAVWLYNAPADAHLLGFVNPGVGKTGRLSTAGPLPGNAARFKKLIVTLETNGHPKAPGAIVLEGSLTGL